MRYGIGDAWDISTGGRVNCTKLAPCITAWGKIAGIGSGFDTSVHFCPSLFCFSLFFPRRGFIRKHPAVRI